MMQYFLAETATHISASNRHLGTFIEAFFRFSFVRIFGEQVSGTCQSGHRIAASGSERSWLGLVLLLTFPISIFPSDVVAQQKYDIQRDAMVRNAVEGEGITNKAVLAAMRNVPRHEFVPPASRARAYDDLALPIGHQQTISPPYIVAYMTETLDPQPEDRVLEIGTGSGYQAAVLSRIVEEVYTIEIVSPLAKQAERRLKDLHFDNVHVLDGDGYRGWPEHAPFDKIIVTCSPENVPKPLIEQLRDGGRMIIPVGERYQQQFHLLKKENGELRDERLISTLFVPMTGQSEEQRQIKPNPETPQIVNGSFELDENNDGKVDGWHYQRQTSICTESPMHGAHCLRFENREFGSISQALQGTAIDGKTIGVLNLNYWVRCEGIVPGNNITDQAALVVHFYDNLRREVSTHVFGKWRGSYDWQNARTTVIVPPAAREMIIRIGLNGATGQLDLDDLKLTPVRR